MRRSPVVLATLLCCLGLATPAQATPAGPAAPELGGGSTLFHLGDPSPAPCTAAFAATDGTGNPVLVAAGSGCGDSGTLYSGNAVEVGPVTAALPGDVVLVQVSDPGAWTVVGWVGDGVTITGSTDPAVGGAVCLIDAGGPTGCGSVTAVDMSVNFPDGVVDHVAATDVVDPGGQAVTFVSGSAVEGVLIGTDAVTSYFQPASRLLADYGLSLLTSA